MEFKIPQNQFYYAKPTINSCSVKILDLQEMHITTSDRNRRCSIGIILQNYYLHDCFLFVTFKGIHREKKGGGASVLGNSLGKHKYDNR